MQVETVNKTHKKRGEEKGKSKRREKWREESGRRRTYTKKFCSFGSVHRSGCSWVAISPLATALGSGAKSLVKDLHAHVLVFCSCLWSYLCCCLFSYCFKLCLFPCFFGFRIYVCVFDLASSAGGAWNLEGLLCCSHRRTHGRTDGWPYPFCGSDLASSVFVFLFCIISGFLKEGVIWLLFCLLWVAVFYFLEFSRHPEFFPCFIFLTLLLFSFSLGSWRVRILLLESLELRAAIELNPL